MKNSGATDSGVGRALLTTKVRLSIQAAIMCFTFGWIPGVLLPLILWFFLATPKDIDVVKTDFLISVLDNKTYRKWRIRDDFGDRKVVSVELKNGKIIQYFLPNEMSKIMLFESKSLASFKMTLLASLLSGLLGHLLIWKILSRLGRKGQESKRLRGAADIISNKILNNMVEKTSGSKYEFATVKLPKMAPMNGIMAQGSQGSGKSLAIHDLMRQVFKNKKKCIIYDHSGEYFRAYFRPGKDYFFNPALIGSVPWSIFSELKYDYDSDTLAQAFLPPKGGVQTGPNAFFEDAARSLFSVILLRLKKLGVENTCDISNAFLEMPEDEMAELIKHSVASSAVGGDSKGQRQGVISSIAIYLNGIAAVEPGNWSIREFLDRDDDARFFILNTEDTQAMFAPLYRLMITVSFSLIAAKQEIVHEDLYWYFLDEVLQLGDIKIDKTLATIRKFGVCIATGIQSESQVSSILGKDRSETVLNCFNTILQLQNNEPNMKERAAKRLGHMEVSVVSTNQALAVSDWRDGAGLSNHERDKWVVRPEEIGELSVCTGYIKFREYPVSKVDYSSWLKSGFFRKCYAARMTVEVNETPPRDPKFLIEQDGEEIKRVSFQEVRESMKAKVDAVSEESSSNSAGDAAGKVVVIEGNCNEADGLSETKNGENGKVIPMVRTNQLITDNNTGHNLLD